MKREIKPFWKLTKIEEFIEYFRLIAIVSEHERTCWCKDCYRYSGVKDLMTAKWLDVMHLNNPELAEYLLEQK